MESLRKYLGYVVFGLFALAAVLGVIFKLTDHLSDQLKGIKDFDSFLMWAASWLARVICWTVIAVMAIIAMVKLGELDAKKADDKVVKLVAIAALAEFLAQLLVMIVFTKEKVLGDLFKAWNWIVLIMSALVLVGAIVRKVSLGGNVLVGKICAAALAVVLLIVFIIELSHLGKTDKTCFIFFIIAFVGAIAQPLLSSELK